MKVYVTEFEITEDGDNPEVIMHFQVADGPHVGKLGRVVAETVGFQIDGVTEGGDGS